MSTVRWKILWVVSLVVLLLMVVWIGGQSSEPSGENYVTYNRDKDISWGPSFTPVPITLPYTVRIIAPGDSTGTNMDAEIYNKLIQGSRIVFVDMSDTASNPEANTQADLNIYVEHLVGVAARAEYDLFPSTYKYLMVNQDMIRIDDIKLLHRVDKFLCKSKTACITLNLPSDKVIYTRHTSTDVLATPTSMPSGKDYNLFVHFAGKSWVKNSEAVLRAWITAGGFPELGFPTLVITCRGRCLRGSTYIQRELASFFDSPRDEKSMLRRHKLYPNILVAESLPDEEYRRYQSLAGFYMCPSQTEGYGHYINEGRSAGAIIITTDAPPMNELVDSSNGVCIPHRSAFRCTESPNLCYNVDVDSIQESVRYLKKLSSSRLQEMSQNSRARYLEDREYFVSVLRTCLT